MSEDQERDGQEGGGVSPESPGDQSAIVSVRGSILASNPGRSRRGMALVPADALPDHTGQRWDRRARKWVAEQPGPLPDLVKPHPQTERVREHKVMRDPMTGRILPGSSGNPSGVSKDGKRHGGRPSLDYRQHLAVLEPLALAALRHALRSPHATVRTTAAQDILDRIHGKPTQPIKDVTPVRLIIHRDY